MNSLQELITYLAVKGSMEDRMKMYQGWRERYRIDQAYYLSLQYDPTTYEFFGAWLHDGRSVGESLKIEKIDNLNDLFARLSEETF